jgi:hypothetical protein
VGGSGANLRRVSRWAYALAFGSLFGYAFYGYRTGGVDGWAATGMLYVWGAMAVIGLAKY